MAWFTDDMLVPILIGMDHLQKTGLILDFVDGHAVNGNESPQVSYTMEKNLKGHYMVNIALYTCLVTRSPPRWRTNSCSVPSSNARHAPKIGVRGMNKMIGLNLQSWRHAVKACHNKYCSFKAKSFV